MHLLAWAGFVALVLALLAVDLGIFNRRAHEITMREAARWSIVTAALAGIFALLIYTGNLPTDIIGGPKQALEFVTGYLIELALSVDNIFVFVLIFSYFSVPARHQHRVLFWGVLGALVFRGAMIGAGSLLLQRFEWIIYVFGAFLVVTGARMATHDDAAIEPESNPVLRLIRRVVPVSREYDGQRFFTREKVDGRWRRAATPLLVVLVLVETTDLVFAVDSIPAIFAVTRNAFVVFTSNVFAILCLRSLYFLLASVIDRFRYLKLGLAAVLVFIGGKMLATGVGVHVETALSLCIVALLLLGSVAASLLKPPKHPAHPASPRAGPDAVQPSAPAEAPTPERSARP